MVHSRAGPALALAGRDGSALWAKVVSADDWQVGRGATFPYRKHQELVLINDTPGVIKNTHIIKAQDPERDVWRSPRALAPCV